MNSPDVDQIIAIGLRVRLIHVKKNLRARRHIASCKLHEPK
jgi:hypothetical protein